MQWQVYAAWVLIASVNDCDWRVCMLLISQLAA